MQRLTQIKHRIPRLCASQTYFMNLPHPRPRSTLSNTYKTSFRLSPYGSCLPCLDFYTSRSSLCSCFSPSSTPLSPFSSTSWTQTSPLPASDIIFLRRLEFFGYHGVYAPENQLGQRFIVDLQLHLDLSMAGRSDHVQDTVNYAIVYQEVKDIMESKNKRNLLEKLAHDIIDKIFHAHQRIHRIQIRVEKPHVAIPGPLGGVGVEVVRDR